MSNLSRRQNILNDMRAVAESLIEGLDATKPNEFANGIFVSIANSIADLSDIEFQLLEQNFSFLQQALQLFPPSSEKSSGSVSFEGTLNSDISGGTFLTVNGQTFETLASAIISNIFLQINKLENSGLQALATFSEPHNMGSGFILQVTGAQAPNDYFNGTFTIVVVDDLVVSYTLATNNGINNDITESTAGVGNGKGVFANPPVQSVTTGEANNAVGDAQATLNIIISGVNSQGKVTALGFTGGSDGDVSSVELSNQFFREPVNLFNDSAIELQVRQENAFVERLFIVDATPSAGSVTTVFTTTDNQIPNASEIIAVKDSILVIKPSTVDSINVIVQAPLVLDFNVTVEGLQPNTQSMKSAVSAALNDYFFSLPPLSVINENTLISVLVNVVDSTGDRLISFFINPITNGLPLQLGSTQVANLNSVIFG